MVLLGKGQSMQPKLKGAFLDAYRQFDAIVFKQRSLASFEVFN